MASASGQANAAAFYGGNQHNDVLRAQPQNESEKSSLVDELKRRGNIAFQAGSLAEADVLYSKAIEHHGHVAALYSNRSMARAGMGQFENALEDANKAVELEPEWPKGYFRQVKAFFGLKNANKAEDALKKCLSLEPNNKLAKKELESLPAKRKKWEGEKAREAERKAKEKEEIEKANETRRILSRTVIDADKAEQDTDKKQSNKPVAKKKGEPDMSMRGYKVLADGRKTSYFHRELSEEDKKFLAANKVDNTPKAVQLSAEEAAKKEAEIKEKGASAWNQAGTFEERDMSKFGRERIEALILENAKCSVTLVDADGDQLAEELKVVALEKVEGHTSIVFARGKKRHVFDYTFLAKWEVMSAAKKITGHLLYDDVSGDTVQEGEELESELRWTDRDRAGKNQAAIKNAVTGPLRSKIDKAIFAFATEFRQID